jgi:integrase
LSPKTVHETHLIVRNALDLAVHRRLVDHNVALAVHSPRLRRGGTTVARVWSAQELGHFLANARPQRLHPALHLVAHTGMRRGELVGLKWRDLDPVMSRLSVCRTIQSLAGTPTEFGAKTRTSRRCIDLDHTTITVLKRWRQQQRADGLPHSPDDWMFSNTKGRHLNPESIAQLFARIVHRSGLPRIRFHDLRHTHASLLVAAGVPIKGGQRTARPRPPRLHHAHLPTPPPRHGCRRRHPLRRAHLHRRSVDVYRPATRELAGQRLVSLGPGRSTR